MSGFLDGTWTPAPGGRYRNRYDAGRALAAALKDTVPTWEGKGVVVGLPRGGMIVARAVANDLKLPIDFRAVRKIGYPGHEEFAIGAADISGVAVKNPTLGMSEMPPADEFDRLAKRALERAREIDQELRGGRPSAIKDADWCLVVDDGAATGLTILAVVKGLKAEGKKVHVAVPVASDQAEVMISKEADSFMALEVPRWFMAVSQFYEDFGEVTTEEAKRTL
jgi:predicted phosphoribosyltransferase